MRLVVNKRDVPINYKELIKCLSDLRYFVTPARGPTLTDPQDFPSIFVLPVLTFNNLLCTHAHVSTHTHTCTRTYTQTHTEIYYFCYFF